MPKASLEAQASRFQGLAAQFGFNAVQNRPNHVLRKPALHQPSDNPIAMACQLRLTAAQKKLGLFLPGVLGDVSNRVVGHTA